MNIPNLPLLMTESSNVHPEVSQKLIDLHYFLTQLITEMQKNVSNEGYVVPNQPTANITALQLKLNTNGALLYDSDTNELKVNINGTFKTITTA